MAVGASATKDWNSFFICFWVVFCIVSHAYVITPTSQVQDWLRSAAKLELARVQVEVSSRRALLNTLIVLNPDTFGPAETTPQGQPVEDRRLSEQAMRWVDPILKPSVDRTNWEAATREALNEAASFTTAVQASESFHGKGGSLSAAWQEKYKDEEGRDKYWKKFIVEGIYAAARIRQKMGLPGRMVPR